MTDPRQDICDAALHIFERRLTDGAGGNYSVRSEGRIYCTPKGAASGSWWRLVPDQIIVATEAGERLGGSGEYSREWAMHLAIYQAFPAVTAVVHAHAENIMTFAHLAWPIPPTSEQTERWGTVPVCEEHPSHTPQLGIAVVDSLRPQVGGLPDRVMTTLIPKHGIVIAGIDLRQCVEALDGIDQSCHILVAKAALLNARDAGH